MVRSARNNQFDFMSAVGILFVIFGHYYQPPYLFYPAYAFHMALFFFISGYFFKCTWSINGKANIIWKKFRKQVIPYFILNFVFGVISVGLSKFGLELGGRLIWQNFLVTPFGRGDQYFLYQASWFLLTLFFVNSVAAVLYCGKKGIDICVAALSAVLLWIGIKYWVQPVDEGYRWVFINFSVRVIIGFFFFSAGYLLHIFEKEVQRFLISPLALFIAFISVDIVNANFADLPYNILFSDLGQSNDQFAHVITTFCIIEIVYWISYYAVRVLKDNSFVYKVGQNTFSIMIWHFTMFWMINVVLYCFGIIGFKDLSDVYYKWYPEKTWLLYTAAGLLGPMGLSYLYKRVSTFLKMKIKKYL